MVSIVLVGEDVLTQGADICELSSSGMGDVGRGERVVITGQEGGGGQKK